MDAPAATPEPTPVPEAAPAPEVTPLAAAPAGPSGPGTAEQIEAWLGRAGRAALRPRVRSVLVGVLLIVLAATVAQSSMWTLPLVIVGTVMIVVAWIGSRMEGRFAFEWGEGGAGLQLQARFKAPAPAPKPLPVSTAPAAAPVSSTAAMPETIEGEAHTIELDLEELRRLIAAAERAGDSTATTTIPVVRANGTGPSH